MLVVAHAHGGTATVEHVGAVCGAASGTDAAAVTVVLASSPRETVYTSNQLARDMEDLTTTLGEGPGVDALTDGPAFAAELGGGEGRRSRWPIFAPAAVDGGVHAAFALPLQVGGIHLGVLDLYRRQPGALEPDQLADALILADTACALLLDATAPRSAGGRPTRAVLADPAVHQATGMVIAQVGVSAAVALVRLRAYAYAHDQRLRDVAASVVAGRLRFRPDLQGGDT